MNAPAWSRPGGGRQQPPVIERTEVRLAEVSRSRNNELYRMLSMGHLDNGQQRKQKLRMNRFYADCRTLAALVHCTDLSTMCAGKRADGEVIGVSRAKILSLADGINDRTLSRVFNQLQRAGLIGRRRRSGKGKGHAIGKATLFTIARGVFKLLGLGDLLEQNRADKARRQAAERAHLADVNQADRAKAATGRQAAPEGVAAAMGFGVQFSPARPPGAP